MKTARLALSLTAVALSLSLSACSKPAADNVTTDNASNAADLNSVGNLDDGAPNGTDAIGENSSNSTL